MFRVVSHDLPIFFGVKTLALTLDPQQSSGRAPPPRTGGDLRRQWIFDDLPMIFIYQCIANLRYPAKNDKFFAGESGNSQPDIKRLKD